MSFSTDSLRSGSLLFSLELLDKASFNAWLGPSDYGMELGSNLFKYDEGTRVFFVNPIYYLSDTRRSSVSKNVWNCVKILLLFWRGFQFGTAVRCGVKRCSFGRGRCRVGTWRTRYWRKTRTFFWVFCASKPVGFSRWRCARMDFVLPLIFEFALSSMATLRGRSHQSRLWGRVSLILEHVSTHGKPCRERTNIT